MEYRLIVIKIKAALFTFEYLFVAGHNLNNMEKLPSISIHQTESPTFSISTIPF